MLKLTSGLKTAPTVNCLKISWTFIFKLSKFQFKSVPKNTFCFQFTRHMVCNNCSLSFRQSNVVYGAQKYVIRNIWTKAVERTPANAPFDIYATFIFEHNGLLRLCFYK